MLDGVVRVFLAEALLVPTGLVTTAFLTHRLGPGDYGVLALAATTVAWIEWSLASIFARSSIKLVGEADDWGPVGATVVRLNLVVGVAAAGLLCLAAGPMAALLGEPSLASDLRLFSLDIPLFALAQAHRHILVGLGRFGPRALAGAGRLVIRMVLILAFVGAGLSVTGAILASIGASAAELSLCRRYVRPRLSERPTFPAGAL